MSSSAESDRDGARADGIDIKPIDVDHLSLVRYVHATALRLQGLEHFTEDEIELFCDAVYEPHYTRELLQQDLIGAWIGGELVGTAGWYASEDGCAARIVSVFVRPPFTRLGLGERLLREVEARARNAGFGVFSLRAGGNSVPFFQRLGYTITSLGLANVAIERGIPVTFMRKADPRAQATSLPTPTTEPCDASG